MDKMDWIELAAQADASLQRKQAKASLRNIVEHAEKMLETIVMHEMLATMDSVEAVQMAEAESEMQKRLHNETFYMMGRLADLQSAIARHAAAAAQMEAVAAR